MQVGGGFPSSQEDKDRTDIIMQTTTDLEFMKKKDLVNKKTRYLNIFVS